MRINLRIIPVSFFLVLSYSAVSVADIYSDACEHAFIAKSKREEMFNFCKRAAIAGDTRAQYLLGAMYYEGVGTEREFNKAAHWWLKAANAGVKEAQYNVGRLFQQGNIFEENPKEAFNWYIKASRNGELYSFNKIGFMLQNGVGVKRDLHNAFQWYMKAARKGLASSQYNIATMYYLGEGVKKDYLKALAWVLLSAEQHFQPALEDLNFFKAGLKTFELQESEELAKKLKLQYDNGRHGKGILNTASVRPSSGEEEIISRIAFRRKNNSQLLRNEQMAEIEKKIVTTLAQYLRITDWKRAAINMRIASIKTDLPVSNVVSLYVSEDSQGITDIRYFSMPIAMESYFLEVKKQIPEERSGVSDISCELILNFNGDYDLKIAHSVTGSEESEFSEDVYSRFADDQMEKYRKNKLEIL